MSAPAWLDELTPTPGPPWLAMGTRGLDVDRWLVVDDDRERDLALKADLLRDHHDEVFVALPSAAVQAASTEVLALVEEAIGQRADDGAGRHPLEAAARLVQEDLCVLVERDGAPHLDAAAVCFPSYWRPRDKVGHPLADVHGPVAHYADELSAKVDRFLARLPEGRPVWRRNWTIHDDPRYHLREAGSPRPDPPVVPPDGLWLRVERQTLRRLRTPRTLVFTIRTQQVPLAVLAERPDVAHRLAAAIAAWSPELRAYKGSHGALLATDWLASRA